MNIKKLITTILALAFIACTALFVACDGGEGTQTPKQIAEIEYYSGLDASYRKNSIIDCTKLKITVIYDNGDTETLIYNEDQFTVTADLSEITDKADVTITYEGFSCVHEVAVTNQYTITSVEIPAFYSAYLSNKAIESTEDNNGFMDNEQEYLVGDDNPFVFCPEIAAIDMNKSQPIDPLPANEVEYVVVLAKWDGEQYVVMDNPGTDADIDNQKASVHFMENAVGGKYKITVRPAEGLTEAQINNPNFNKSIEVKVVDGYNVYTADELSIIDNGYIDRGGDVSAAEAKVIGEEWAQIRQEAGITVDPSDVNAIILHDNIKITVADIPASLILKEGDPELKEGDADFERAKNSLRDYNDIYYRNLTQGKSFNIYGNYFNVNASELPLVAREGKDANNVMNADDVVVSHATLIKFAAYDKNDEFFENTEQSSIQNVSFTGNIKRAETIATGGLMLFKGIKLNVNVYNVIARQWYTIMFNELNSDEVTFVMEKNKLYDTYSAMLYNWGGNMVVKNSVLKGSGGPAFIADNCYFKNDDVTAKYPDGYVPNMEIDENTVIEAYVTGSEGWFVQMGASSMCGQILSLDGLFNYYGARSYIIQENDVKKFNLVGVIKSGYAEAMTFEKIKGSASIGDHVMDMTAPVVPQLGGMSVFDAFQGQTIIFQASQSYAALMMGGPEALGGYMLCDAVNAALAVAMQGDVTATQVNAAHGLFAGEYLNLYIGIPGNSDQGYMGVILGNYRSLV